MPTQRFIPVEELRRLARGSYEHVISAVDQMVQENARALFGEEVVAEVVGTFAGNALVLSENGKLIKVHFERSETPGKLKILRHEMLDVPTYNSGNVEDFVRKEVRAAIGAWKAGRVAEAEEKISRVAPYISDRPPMSDKKVDESLIKDLCVNRAWKQVMEKNSDPIREAIGRVEMSEIESTITEAKFRPLYSGAITEANTTKYRDLVRSDLAYLTSRVESLKALVESSYEAARSVIGSESLKGEEAISTLVLFTEDLILDLRRLHQVLSESRKLTEIGCLGRLHDAVVAGLPNYEIAGRFVAATSKRLHQSS